MSRVVVIGAGVGGLAAAARLAAQGHRVTVCEQADTVGGKLGVHEQVVPRVGAFRHDTGPSLLTLPQVFRDLFADTGAPLEDVLELVPLSPVARYRFPDGTGFDSLSDLDAFCAELDSTLGGTAGADWRAFTERAARIWEITREPFLENPLDGLGSLLRLARERPRDIPTIAPRRSLRRLGEEYLHDPRLRTFLDRYATYTGSDPRRAPAALATVPYAELHHGGFHVAGGLRRLGEEIARRALELGAEIVQDADVARVVTTDGAVSAVMLTDGTRIAADVVVANADASHLYGDLVHVPGQQRRLARAQASFSGVVLLLAVRGRTPGVAHHNVWFPADYDAEFDALNAGRVVAEPTLYAAVPDDAAMAPAGHESWFVLVNAPRHEPRGGTDWDAEGLAESYADTLLDQLAARGPDLRGRVLARTVLTPADLERRTRAVGGAIYGTSSNGARAAFLRPANRSPVPGLFLVGGSSHPGGGLPLVALSARIVARMIGPA